MVVFSIISLRFGHSHNFTRLCPDLRGGVDPDDAFSSVPYEKGFALMCRLEQAVGGALRFCQFLREDYFPTFAGKTITSDQFRQFLLDSFPDCSEALGEVMWDKWFNEPGMPPYWPEVGSGPVMTEIDCVVGLWEELAVTSDPLTAPASVQAVRHWPSEKVLSSDYYDPYP
jgi:leukotriene-A4 hydrolase